MGVDAQGRPSRTDAQPSDACGDAQELQLQARKLAEERDWWKARAGGNNVSSGDAVQELVHELANARVAAAEAEMEREQAAHRAAVLEEQVQRLVEQVQSLTAELQDAQARLEGAPDIDAQDWRPPRPDAAAAAMIAAVPVPALGMGGGGGSTTSSPADTAAARAPPALPATPITDPVLVARGSGRGSARGGGGGGDDAGGDGDGSAWPRTSSPLFPHALEALAPLPPARRASAASSSPADAPLHRRAASCPDTELATAPALRLNMRRVEALLARVPALRTLDHHQLSVMAACLDVLEFEPGEALLRAGELADLLLLMLSGTAVEAPVATAQAEQATPTQVRRLEAGAVVGGARAACASVRVCPPACLPAHAPARRCAEECLHATTSTYQATFVAETRVTALG